MLNPGAIGIRNAAVETGSMIPVKLNLCLVKTVTKGRENSGNQSRYFHCYVGGRNVDRFVSDLTGLKQSKGKDTKEAIIIHGCGMDMAFALQEKCRAKAPWLFAETYGAVTD